MAPHLPQFDREILFRLIRRNVIPRAELELLELEYDELFAAKHGGGPVRCHAFASMFKIGLLGYVGMHPETAELVQYFRYPGEVPLDRNDVLPDAEHFLVHPSLDLLIGGYNPDYFRHLDKLNVIGADRPWRSARQTQFVLKGDVRGAGTIFQDPVAGASFPAFFAEAVAEAGRDLAVARATDGDSALLIDPNPRQVVMAALSLRQRLQRSDYACDIRFGGDAGFVELMGEGEGAQARAGLALLVAARLEPHAPAGTILVTGQFVEAWRNLLGAGAPTGAARGAGRGAAIAGKRRALRSRQARRRGADAAAAGPAGRPRLDRLSAAPLAGAASLRITPPRSCSSARSPAGRDTCRSSGRCGAGGGTRRCPCPR